MRDNITGILLAAGLGTRLGDITADIPKSIIPLQGRPLIWYAIHAMRRIGVNRIIVVGGFEFEKLKRAALESDANVEIYENPDYTKGNIFTLKTALDHIESGGFLLTHVDHVFQNGILDTVKEQMEDEIMVFTDTDRNLTDDDMKVKTDEAGKFFVEASKKLTDYNCGYVGLTYCSAQHLDHYKSAVKEAIVQYGEKAVTEHAMQSIANNPPPRIHVGDISGFKWLEIDFPEEYERAKEELALHEEQYI